MTALLTLALGFYLGYAAAACRWDTEYHRGIDSAIAAIGKSAIMKIDDF